MKNTTLFSVMRNRIFTPNNLIIFAALYFSLAVIGAFKNYSPVPFGDMWTSSEFFFKISNGDFSAFWQQHNEHRIVLSRMLFWMDETFFAGSNIFLIILNYFFAFSASLIFLFCAKESLKNSDEKNVKIVGAIIFILLFCWTQKENFVWEFQSQFFLAQLLPLVSFYLLHRSYQSRDNSVGLFILACFAGVISIGTMANGVLVLPLMTLMALALRMNYKFVVACAALSALALSAYFYDYSSSQHHSSLLDSIAADPMGLTKFILSYLGNPLRYFGRVIPRVAGLILVLSSAVMVLNFIKNPARYSSLQISLLALIIYVEITAIATGGGRLVFGIGQSFTGRYTTPTLMAWSALLTIFAPFLAETKFRKKISYLAIIAILLPVALLPKQLEALESAQEEIFMKSVGALALKLGVKDKQAIDAVYPQVEMVGFVNDLKIPAEKNWSIFGNPIIKDAKNLIGTKESILAPNCSGKVEIISAIPSEENYVSVAGSIFNDAAKSTPTAIHILNQDGEVVGYALIGKSRKNPQVSDDNLSQDFKGYLLSEASAKHLNLALISPDSSLIYCSE